MDAVARARSLERNRVRDAIETTRGLIGTGGVFSMTPRDHLGLDLGSFHMVEIRNGDWALVD